MKRITTYHSGPNSAVLGVFDQLIAWLMMLSGRATAVPMIVLLAMASVAQAQPTFSIDYQGPTMGGPPNAFPVPPPPFFPRPVFEGDILTPPLPGLPMGAASLGPFFVAPGVVINGSVVVPGDPPGLGLAILVFQELDALSYGDEPLLTMAMIAPGSISFSVDEFAIGLATGAAPPTVFSEGAFGAMEASADVFVNAFGLPAGGTPLIAPGLAPIFPAPAVAPVGNTQTLDGDGIDGATGAPVLGLALIEPNPPLPGVPDLGDNLDALDVDTTVANLAGPIYFSLDAAFIDPLEAPAGAPPNTATAFLNGFDAADVLVVVPDLVLGAPAPAIAVFAPAAALGLDLFPGMYDDLDALILAENDTGVFEPSAAPYDWLTGATDMLLFSVRRGSAIIGMADSIYGVPIEEGDILTTPFFGPGNYNVFGVLDGPAPIGPGIFIPAEWLGLATMRSGTAAMFGDDLDALDLVLDVAIADCNGNDVPDSDDIATGFSIDCNANGIPDECDIAGGVALDCNGNGVPDPCDLASGFSLDCNYNGAPDSCDIASGVAADCNSNGVPDECDISPISFADAVAYPAGTDPIALGMGDMDGDGDQDLVTLDIGFPAEAMVYLNSGAGAFGLAGTYAVGVDAADLALADVDGDGDLDLAIAHISASVAVHFNDGAGALGAATTYATAAGSNGVIAADLDGDADLDLIVSNYSAGSVSVLVNAGDGSFGAAVAFATGAEPAGLAAADFDADGDLDLAVGRMAFPTSLSILINTSAAAISFAAPVAVPLGEVHAPVAAGDLDSDGDADLAVGLNSGTLAVALNTSVGGVLSFSAPVLYDVGDLPQAIASGDVDADGDLDLIVTNLNGSSISVMRNFGDSTLMPQVELDLGVNTAPRDACMGDLDGDGDVDLAVARQYVSNLGVLLNTSPAPTSEDENSNGVPDECEPGDVNGDGIVNVLDLLGVIGAWGACPAIGPCPADLNGDGVVNVLDLLLVISNFD